MTWHRCSSRRGVTRTTKLILCKTVILPVLFYSAEAWTLLNTDAAALLLLESKVLRKIFGPLGFGADFRIRFNSELYEFFNDLDVLQHINIQWLRWFAHVTLARRIFDVGICGCRRRERLCTRWKDQINEDIS